MMTRSSINFWLDAVSLVVMLALAATGGVIHFVLPSGTGHTHLLFGLGRHDFGQLHFYLALSAISLLFLHVTLHWEWICCVVAKACGCSKMSSKAQMAWGLALLFGIIILLVGGLWWSSSQVIQRAGQPGEHRGRGWRQQGMSASPASVNDSETAKSHANSEPATPAKETPSSSAPLTPSVGVPPRHEKHLEECPAGMAINGRTTLQEAAAQSGLTVEQLRSHLKLPTNVDASQPLGRLKRVYDFSIYDVRQLVCRR